METLASDRLEALIRNALTIALMTGCGEVAAKLDVALRATNAPEPARCEIDVLAGAVRSHGVAISLSRGELALLTVLALQPRACRREELADMLYPHLDADVGFSQLKVYVHRVRRKLGYAQAILFEAEAYRLAPDVLVDLVDAEAAVADAVPTRGALAPASRARLNEIRRRLLARRIIWTDDREWCNALERRLESLLSDVTWRLGEAALADGDFAAATRLAAEVCMLDPSDERAAEIAIRAHLRAGDDLGARTRFRRYERVLKKEFDMSPSAELAALVTQTARATA